MEFSVKKKKKRDAHTHVKTLRNLMAVLHDMKQDTPPPQFPFMGLNQQVVRRLISY